MGKTRELRIRGLDIDIAKAIKQLALDRDTSLNAEVLKALELYIKKGGK